MVKVSIDLMVRQGNQWQLLYDNWVNGGETLDIIFSCPKALCYHSSDIRPGLYGSMSMIMVIEILVIMIIMMIMMTAGYNQ